MPAINLEFEGCQGQFKHKFSNNILTGIAIASGMTVKTTLALKNWWNVNISLGIKLNYDASPWNAHEMLNGNERVHLLHIVC